MIEPRSLSLQEAREAVSAGTAPTSGTPDAPPAQLIAEMLRETLCALSRPMHGRDPWQPVYVTRLTNAVRRRLAPLWPPAGSSDPNSDSDAAPAQDEAWHDVTRKVLGCLEDIGDAINCDDGYWLPSPIRFVKLPTGRIIVLAGFGTPILRMIVGPDVRQEGFARALHGTSPPPEDERWQDLATWRGVVPELRAWTQATITKAWKNLQQSAQEFTDFEAYAPRVKRTSLQYYRWIRRDSLSYLPRDLVLCRSAHGSPRNYWLGKLQVSSGRIVLVAETPISAEHVRRLQYGLDLEAGLPTRAQMIRERQRAVLHLPNPLPAEERRVLLALAASSDGFVRPPIECTLSEEALPEVLTMLKALGIQISESDLVGAS